MAWRLEEGRRCSLQQSSGTESSGQPLVLPVLVARGPRALVFLALDERTQAEGSVLAGWGWTWEQAVCLSQGWVPAWLPIPPFALSSLPQERQVDACRPAQNRCLGSLAHSWALSWVLGSSEAESSPSVSQIPPPRPSPPPPSIPSSPTPKC